MNWIEFIQEAIDEDVQWGDHTSLATISADRKGKAELIVKSNGIIAGVELAEKIFHHFDKDLQLKILFVMGVQ